MYYHCRPLKHVEYGKIFPPSDEVCDFLHLAYRWLSNYCGYCPQVWLARSKLSITGYKNKQILKKRQNYNNKRTEVKERLDNILFGFDIIKGYPVNFNSWEFLLGSLINNDTFEKQNADIISCMNEILKDYRNEGEEPEGEIKNWLDSGKDLDTYLRKYVFVEVDQVVVPSLNLKAAKQIICRDEKQKKTLRKMGFIENRIHIKNIVGGSV